MTPTEPLNAAHSSGSQDSKNFKKVLMDQVRAGGGTQAMDTKQLFQTRGRTGWRWQQPLRRSSGRPSERATPGSLMLGPKKLFP